MENNIVFKGSKRIVDVKSLSDKELSKLYKEKTTVKEEIMKKIEDAKKTNTEIYSKMMGVLSLFMVAEVIHGVGSVANGRMDLQTLFAALSVTGLIIGANKGFHVGIDKYLDKREAKKVSEIEEEIKPAKQEMDDRWDEKAVDSLVKTTEEQLKSQYDRLKSIDEIVKTKSYKLDGMNSYSNKLIDAGADPEFVMSPAVQEAMKIIALYSRSNYEVNDIKPDGSFVMDIRWVSTRDGGQFAVEDPELYDVCKLPNGEIAVYHNGMKIHYDNQGKIADVSKKEQYKDRWYTTTMDKDGNFNTNSEPMMSDYEQEGIKKGL